ncbi:MAG: phage holin family protein [Anaerolineae bacterium]
MSLLLRIIINALAVAVTIYLVPGIQGPHLTNLNAVFQYLVIGIIFGLVNALLKPILTLLSCSLVMLTFGLFIFVINGFLLWLTSVLAQWLGIPFTIDGFVPLVVGTILISIVSFVLNVLVPERR